MSGRILGGFYCSYDVLCVIETKQKSGLCLTQKKCICSISWTLKLQLCFRSSEIYFISLNIIPQQPISSGWGRRNDGWVEENLLKDMPFYCNLCALLWNNLPFSLMFQIGQGQMVLTVLIQTANIFNSRVYTDKREKSNYLPPSIPLFTKGFCWVLGIFLLRYYSTSV